MIKDKKQSLLFVVQNDNKIVVYGIYVRCKEVVLGSVEILD